MSISTTTTPKATQVLIRLTDSTHGFDDYDLEGDVEAHRICVPHGIKRGNIFNVYSQNCIKRGAIWEGSIKKSLAKFFGRAIDLQGVVSEFGK